VWNMFGPTETTIWSTLQRVDAGVLDGVSVPIGRPIAGTVCRVLDAAGGLSPIGVPGELFIGGVGVARGYLDRPELTAARFVADPFAEGSGGRLYRTGDLARWLPDGRLEFMGRLDFQVKVRGHRIELGEIESVLRGLAGVVDAVVVADGVADAGRLLAYPIFEPGVALTVGELRAGLLARLPDYMVPSLFIPVESFPLTANRKIDRQALPRPDDAAPVATAYVAPRSDVERVVAGIVGDTIGVDRVGVDDDFFELGGHSLNATGVLARIESTFGVRVELRAFFVAPTVADLAAFLTADPSTAANVARVAQLRVKLAAMSPEEVAAALAARRAGGQGGAG
jgi:acyl carrier protein